MREPVAIARRRELFWKRVEKGPGCWQHSGSLGSHGYPQATTLRGGRSEPAQRVALEIALGRTLEPGEMGLHACNNKRCVRVDPAHVYLGDHRQNMDDVARAGHPRRKLTPEQAREIKGRLAAGEQMRPLAREYHVSQKAMQNIARGVTYRHA